MTAPSIWNCAISLSDTSRARTRLGQGAACLGQPPASACLDHALGGEEATGPIPVTRMTK